MNKNESRRKLLKSIAAGSGAIVAGKSLPESWSRPVVDSVMLPAHAQTSTAPPAPPAPSSGPFAGGATTNGTSLESESLLEELADTLVPEAKANGVDYQNPYVCVAPNEAGDMATIRLYIDRNFGNGPETHEYTFSDVPVEGSKDLSKDKNLCIAVGGVGDMLDDLGLIKNAHAIQNITCFLDSVTGVGAGRIEFDGGPTVNYSVGEASCSPTTNCPI